MYALSLGGRPTYRDHSILSNQRKTATHSKNLSQTHPDGHCFLLIELESPLGALGEVVDDAACVLGGRLHGDCYGTRQQVKDR